ncbi:transcriptional regulator Nrg1 [Kwoniella mangroviensis CBS 10435]|uniref:Transcriptional regulator Nrg1 n=1 Tax=Kwoniella mangroviensis CBS 10435 TaxID=1331196 RepID=A0A1B9IWB0_9TREE|nr:transcriptional regulator Nrg1 [Kwoniella mangroviensis CBS 10435]
MSAETSPHLPPHLPPPGYNQHSNPLTSTPSHMSHPPTLHDSPYGPGDTSITSIKTDESSVNDSPGPVASSKGKNGATGPAEGKTKPHVCPICNRGFTTGGHLQRHHRIHTGVKAFKCPFPGCETKTSRQDNLQQHYRTHLSPTLRRGSGSAARAAVNAAMEAAGLKSSSRASRKSKGSAGGTPSSTASGGHLPSPYATPTSQGPAPYAPYMYDPQHGYPAYPIPPPGVSLAQSQSAASSRVPSPVNGHSSGHSSVGSMPPAHQQPFFSQPYTSPYTAYPGVHQQPYRYGPAGGIPSPYGAHPHHGLYSPGLASEHGQHMYSPMQSNFQTHSRESSYGVLTPGYGGNPMANGYPPRTQTSTPLSQTHDDYGRRPPSPGSMNGSRRRSPPHDMLGQGVVDPSSMSTRMGGPPGIAAYGGGGGYGHHHNGMPPYGYGQPISQPHSRNPSGHRASVSSLSEDGSGNGGSEGSKGE